ncbi:hypothetical protein HOY82DRAFT_571989 [Tuber indicum]|nr:hypothetical protein HOY82DRAFT_571989 [Tuber indicum]
MATIVVTPSSSAQPHSNPSGIKPCAHCRGKKPVADYARPGTNELLKTCISCRQGRAAARARDRAKRKRKIGNGRDPPQSRRKTEHPPSRTSPGTSSKQAAQRQHSSSSSPLSSPPLQPSPSPSLSLSTNLRAAPPPPTPLSASSDSSRVRTETVNFAASLSRLAGLVSSATEALGDERLMALAEEIHHDWKVDEMATFIDGFLKGAAGASQDRTW